MGHSVGVSCPKCCKFNGNWVTRREKITLTYYIFAWMVLLSFVRHTTQFAPLSRIGQQGVDLDLHLRLRQVSTVFQTSKGRKSLALKVSESERRLAEEKLMGLSLAELKAAYERARGGGGDRAAPPPPPGAAPRTKKELAARIVDLLAARTAAPAAPAAAAAAAAPAARRAPPRGGGRGRARGAAAAAAPSRLPAGPEPPPLGGAPARPADGGPVEYIAPDEGYNRTAAALEGVRNSDTHLAFLGTASCMPGITRSVSCTALRRGGETWLFDAGECTQLQIQRSEVRPSRVTRVFCTHMHGDHTFGLPGLLCTLGQEKEFREGPVHIYGPQGIRNFVVATIQLSYSKIVPPFIVHELMDVPMFSHGGRQQWAHPEPFPELRLGRERQYGELGHDYVYPDARGVWTLFEEDGIAVRAAALQHSLPCVGFVVEEAPRPGALRPELVIGHLKRNMVALKAAGVPDPMKLMGRFKDLGPGEEYALPDGHVVRGSEVVAPAQPGRKIVICGDTSNAGAGALPLIARGCDVLVHEATNAFLPPWDQGTYDEVEYQTRMHGHSTPQMAARFARKIGAKRLVLNHFSPRYKGDEDPHSIMIMRRIEQAARNAGGYAGNEVIAAWDLFQLPVPFQEDMERNRMTFEDMKEKKQEYFENKEEISAGIIKDESPSSSDDADFFSDIDVADGPSSASMLLQQQQGAAPDHQVQHQQQGPVVLVNDTEAGDGAVTPTLSNFQESANEKEREEDLKPLISGGERCRGQQQD